MKVLLLTREYPPDVYGGAGVHVEYLARELANLATVEVRTFGRQAAEVGPSRSAVTGRRARWPTSRPPPTPRPCARSGSA